MANLNVVFDIFLF